MPKSLYIRWEKYKKASPLREARSSDYVYQLFPVLGFELVMGLLHVPLVGPPGRILGVIKPGCISFPLWGVDMVHTVVVMLCGDEKTPLGMGFTQEESILCPASLGFKEERAGRA